LMSRLSQVINSKPSRFKQNSRLFGNPQKKAICLSVFTISPKKPNSANRRITRVKIPSLNKIVVAKIPGEQSSNLQQHSTVLVHGARVKDLIGVSLATIRGKLDLQGISSRKTSRSRYGTSKSN
jgi:small subunit ribosomal protein S12